MASSFSKTRCPVPAEQQPLNEYRELQESWFYGWVLFDLPKYIRTILWVWGLGWAIAGPVAAVSFVPGKHPMHFFLMASAGASLFPLLGLVWLYCGWAYVQARLANPTVVYEETGWYDGQSWKKPAEVLSQDRLVVAYEVKPLIQRLQWTFGALGLLWLSGGVVWVLL